MDPRLLLRDPALLGAVLVALVNLFAVIGNWSVDQTSAANAVVTALVGVAVAVMVRSDSLVPLLAGLLKAVGALLIGFGLEWSPQAQAAAMTVAVAVSALAVRTQVTAPVPAAVRPPVHRGNHTKGAPP